MYLRTAAHLLLQSSVLVLKQQHTPLGQQIGLISTVSRCLIHVLCSTELINVAVCALLYSVFSLWTDRENQIPMLSAVLHYILSPIFAVVFLVLKPVGKKKQFYPHNKCIFVYVFYLVLHLKLQLQPETWIKKEDVWILI